MDPLSITASVVGLIKAAGKVAGMIASFTSRVEDAPQLAQTVKCEINDVQTALSSLHLFFLRWESASESRTALIQLDQLIITLTEAVLTFSELETVVKSLVVSSASSYRSRIKWARKEETIVRLMARLQRHKSSLSLMLNIVQCESDMEASQSQSLLSVQIEQLLSNNQELCERLRKLEDAFDARSTLTKRLEDASILEDDEEGDSQTITTGRPYPERLGGPAMQANVVRFVFEDDLEASRVYRNARNAHCDASFTSSVARTNAWSIFSGLSLADISVISVIALPIYSHDIDHNEWYAFGRLNNYYGDVSPQFSCEAFEHTTSHSSDCVSPLFFGEDSKETTKPIIVGDDVTAQESPEQRNKEESDERGANQNIFPNSDEVTAQGSPEQRKNEESDERGANQDNISNNDDDDDIDCSNPTCGDDDDICRNCGETLGEGKGFEIAGNHWHIDCFRCNTCGTLLDSDANQLLHGDGCLVCSDCTYSCNLCGNKIEDLAILTGDQAFCANCFRCRNCKRKIEELRYARSRKGVFCMSCHESLMARRRRKHDKAKDALQSADGHIDNDHLVD